MDTFFFFWKNSEIWYNEQIRSWGVKMNIQRLRYVGGYSNRLVLSLKLLKKMYVSQPSLSISVRGFGKELGFWNFLSNEFVNVLTRRGMDFLWKRKTGQRLWCFSKSVCQSWGRKDEFSIASQLYDFLPPTITALQNATPPILRHFHYFFESTTVQILRTK